MGLKCSPDIVQAIMKNVLTGTEDADVYINDVGAFFKDWKHCMNFLTNILCNLWENYFTIYLLKCEWVIKK